MAGFTVVLDDERTQGALSRLIGATTDMTPLMRDLGEYLITATKDRFATGAGPDGTIWAPKSATTLAAYARRGDPADLRPLFGPTGSLSKTIFYEAGPTQVSWGSPMVYAAMMQFGGARAAFPHLWGDIPARPFIGLSDDDIAAIGEEVEEWLERAADAGSDAP
ncbi:MAG: phage virion morphogenesis protein [Gemmobacter sp.]